MAQTKKKTDAVQMEARVAEVVDLIIAGLTVKEMHRFLAEKRADWDVGPRQRARLITRARADIAAASKPLREEELGKALRRYSVLYRRAFAINDYKTCASIVKLITDLLGLAPPQRRELTGADGGPIQHESRTVTELDREIERLLAGFEPGEQEPTVQSADRLPPGFTGAA